MSWLINAGQVDKFRKNQKNLVILDASYHHAENERNAKQEFAEKHIVDAQFFDIDFFSDPNAELPHTLITDEKIISEKMSSLGIRNDMKIIIYDNSDLHSAARALWMFKVFGHDPQLLYILDGGFKAWELYDGKTESGLSSSSSKTYTARLQPQYLRTLDQVKENYHHPKEQILDARHPIRYAGGHIPGSICFPYFTMYEKDGLLKPLEKIRKQMLDVAIDLKSPIIASCGSGITAATLDLVLDLMGHAPHALYDGSWSEWGNPKLYPGETSLDERPVETCVDG